MTIQQKTAWVFPASDQIKPNDHSSESHNHDISEPTVTSAFELVNFELDSNQLHNNEHLNKINEAVILHHEGIKAFLSTYNDVQVIKAFHFQATDRFLIFCKDLKVNEKKHKEEYCLFWWDWKNCITTKVGDYVDCYFKYRELINLMGNPPKITLPESPDLTEYYRNVTYCPADGKRGEQFTLSLGV